MFVECLVGRMVGGYWHEGWGVEGEIKNSKEEWPGEAVVGSYF